MAYTNNHEKFPDMIFPPERIHVDDETYTMYKTRFRNLYELYEYLKADPEINRRVFSELSSIEGKSSFAGKPYAAAVEDLIATIDPGYEEFLKLQKDINRGRNIMVHKFRTVRTVAGGHLNIPAYSAGAPLCYETEERISKPRFIRIHLSLSYYWGTTKDQVLHRAVIITNVVKALENAGYSVDVNAFEMSSCANELINIIVELKKHGGRINMSALYKTLCHVEFLRRILFRVLETLAVQAYWGDGYGSTCSEEFIRQALKLGKDDIFFDQPREMGIEGENLAEDFEAAMEHLNLRDKIDVRKAKQEFNDAAKSLRKIRN